METIAVSNVVDLWEAWVDVSEGFKLYVLGTVHTGRSKTTPVLVKRKVPGVPSSHLILEVLPCLHRESGRQTEIAYTESVSHLNQYNQISICAGEDVLVRIHDIEVFY